MREPLDDIVDGLREDLRRGVYAPPRGSWIDEAVHRVRVDHLEWSLRWWSARRAERVAEIVREIFP